MLDLNETTKQKLIKRHEGKSLFLSNDILLTIPELYYY